MILSVCQLPLQTPCHWTCSAPWQVIMKINRSARKDNWRARWRSSLLTVLDIWRPCFYSHILCRLCIERIVCDSPSFLLSPCLLPSLSSLLPFFFFTSISLYLFLSPFLRSLFSYFCPSFIGSTSKPQSSYPFPHPLQCKALSSDINVQVNNSSWRKFCSDSSLNIIRFGHTS